MDRVKTLVVTRMKWMPSGRTAPRQTTPHGSFQPRELRKFYDALVAMDACLLDAERRFGNKVKVLDHPVLGPLTVEEWRRFHHTHAKHHLKQISKLAQCSPTAARASRAAG